MQEQDIRLEIVTQIGNAHSTLQALANRAAEAGHREFAAWTLLASQDLYQLGNKLRLKIPPPAAAPPPKARSRSGTRKPTLSAPAALEPKPEGAAAAPPPGADDKSPAAAPQGTRPRGRPRSRSKSASSNGASGGGHDPTPQEALKLGARAGDTIPPSGGVPPSSRDIPDDRPTNSRLIDVDDAARAPFND